MAIDIHGWIEVRPLEWHGAVSLSFAGWRDYWVFDALFGTSRVSPRFFPIAARRGVPSDPSKELLSDLADYGPSIAEDVTWVLWADVAALDWTHVLEWPTIEIDIFSNALDGPKFRCTKSHASLLSAEDDEELLKLGSLERRGHTYRLRKGVAPLHVSEQWQHLFSLCRDLSDNYGPQQVRLVAWFE